MDGQVIGFSQQIIQNLPYSSEIFSENNGFKMMMS